MLLNSEMDKQIETKYRMFLQWYGKDYESVKPVSPSGASHFALMKMGDEFHSLFNEWLLGVKYYAKCYGYSRIEHLPS